VGRSVVPLDEPELEEWGPRVGRSVVPLDESELEDDPPSVESVDETEVELWPSSVVPVSDVSDEGDEDETEVELWPPSVVPVSDVSDDEEGDDDEVGDDDDEGWDELDEGEPDVECVDESTDRWVVVRCLGRSLSFPTLVSSISSTSTASLFLRRPRNDFIEWFEGDDFVEFTVDVSVQLASGATWMVMTFIVFKLLKSLSRSDSDLFSA